MLSKQRLIATPVIDYLCVSVTIEAVDDTSSCDRQDVSTSATLSTFRICSICLDPRYDFVFLALSSVLSKYYDYDISSSCFNCVSIFRFRYWLAAAFLGYNSAPFLGRYMNIYSEEQTNDDEHLYSA